jgi:hypothetical protein
VIKLAIKYNVVQIVPRRANRFDGIGDYSTHLAHAMLERAGANSVFVSGTPARTEAPRADRWQTYPVLRRTRDELAKQLAEICRDGTVAAVILHVSGYGYQKRGVPFWLLEGMRIWRQAHRHCRLFGVFHELYATGRVWKSSFWLSNEQKYITQGLWELCDGGLTPAPSYFDELIAWRPNMKRVLRTMPVFSNVGEPSFGVPAENRPHHMAVFGQPGVERVYTGAQFEVAASIAEQLRVKKILDIGARTVAPPRQLGRIPITCLGQLAADSVSNQLISCRFGLLNYDVKRLQKSTIFAAYAAHGVIPVCIGSQANASDALEEGQHFLRWPSKTVPDLGVMQIKLMQWYEGHSIPKHADFVTRWCRANDGVQRMQAVDAMA